MPNQIIPYAEHVGDRFIDWDAIIEGKGYSLEDIIIKYKVASRVWATCAVGQQSHLILRDKEGEPYDQYLRHLGCTFAGYIKLMGDFNIRGGNIVDNSVDGMKFNSEIISRLRHVYSEIVKQSDKLHRQQVIIRRFGFIGAIINATIKKLA